MAALTSATKGWRPSYWNSFPLPHLPNQHRNPALTLDVSSSWQDTSLGNVFDMGCGTGALAVPLGLAGHKVVAADFSRGMLDRMSGSAKSRPKSTRSSPCS